MSDLLVKLYEMPPHSRTSPGSEAWSLRKPIGPEHRLLTSWVAQHFSAGWSSETQVGLGNRPVSIFIALQGTTLLGFACYDATARGFFGPVGVLPAARGRGIGAALLRACLDDMHSVGYGYAVIGGAGPTDFYRRTVGAVEIPGSSPGIYRGMLKAGSQADQSAASSSEPSPHPALPVRALD